jgi:hypothetical protein
MEEGARAKGRKTILTPASAPAGDVLIFEYGIRLDKESLDPAITQIMKARRLYNALIAIMRDVVAEMQVDTMARAGPEARATQAAIDDFTAQFAAAKAANDEAAMARIAEARREAWRALAAQLKGVRQAARADHKARFFSRIGRTTDTATYQARCQAVADGLGWATANAILENALDAFRTSIARGRAPRFASAAEKEQDTLTLQFTTAGGLAVSDLLGGKHGDCQLLPSNGCGRRKYGEFRFRLGLAKSEQFATGTWQYHRALPADASVGVARLVRRRIGKDYRWYVQLQVKCPVPIQMAVGPRKALVALHFGWAADVEGRRIAGIADSADPGAALVLQLPSAIEAGLARAAEIQAERDRRRDEIAPRLKELSVDGLTEELAAEVIAVGRLPAQHVALGRLHRLCRQLRDVGGVPEWLEEWRKVDRIAWQSTAHLARRTRNARRDYYRKTALGLATAYQTIVIEPLDLAEAATKIDETTGKRTEFAKKARAGRVVAALYELESAIRWAAVKTGAVVLELTGATASLCGYCGAAATASDDDHQSLHCTDCGAQMDRKRNGAAIAWQMSEPLREEAIEDYYRQAGEAEAKRVQAKAERLTKVVEARRARTARAAETP